MIRESAKTSPRRGQLAPASRRAPRSRHGTVGIREPPYGESRARAPWQPTGTVPEGLNRSASRREPARSVAADRVNVACCQATPRLDSPESLTAARPKARPRFPLIGVPSARGRANTISFSNRTRTLLPARSGPGEDRSGRLRNGATRGATPDERGQLASFSFRGMKRQVGQHARAGRSRIGVPLPSETTREPGINNRNGYRTRRRSPGTANRDARS